ncbi:MAG TPA: hypothetical protein VF897_08715 [Roseiflexaceae bacterium]
MATTWLPHLLTNTVSLLLPDALRLVARERRPGKPAGPQRPTPGPRSIEWCVIGETLSIVVRDNPGYALYVAPLAAGYLLSSPWLNIYKGDLAQRRLACFGLDALPHAATAFALTRLVDETVRTASGLASPDAGLGQILTWASDRRAVVSAALLALATLGWEYGEYTIHLHELALRGDSREINMQWSLSDTWSDCLANAIGWCLALALERRSPSRVHANGQADPS